MSGAQLAALVDGGEVPPGGGLCAEVQPVLRETLLRHAGAEQERRAARRRAEQEEERRREARLREAEAFRGVRALAARAREAKELAPLEERAMAELLRQL